MLEVRIVVAIDSTRAVCSSLKNISHIDVSIYVCYMEKKRRERRRLIDIPISFAIQWNPQTCYGVANNYCLLCSTWQFHFHFGLTAKHIVSHSKSSILLIINSRFATIITSTTRFITRLWSWLRNYRISAWCTVTHIKWTDLKCLKTMCSSTSFVYSISNHWYLALVLALVYT